MGRLLAAQSTPLAQIRSGLDAFLKPDTRIPFALVVEIDGNIRGNALVIANDEEARPELTPWLAALWVDEVVRGRASRRRCWRTWPGDAPCWVSSASISSRVPPCGISI